MSSEYHMTDKDKGTKDQIPIVKDSDVPSGIKTPPLATDKELGIFFHTHLPVRPTYLKLSANIYILTNTAKEDMEAMDSSNIIDKRTRGASPTGDYKEPGDTEGLPDNDGTSAIAR